MKRKQAFMRLHYGGKYTEDSVLPVRDIPENAVKFKEPESMESLGRHAAVISAAILLPLLAISLFFTNGVKPFFSIEALIGFALSIITAPVHEMLHAICFREDVYLFTNIKQGMLFVVGTESMSKERFIFMSLLPNFVLGAVPYLIFIYDSSLIMPGAMGVMAIPMGAGDYLNVWNASVQMPKGAKTFISGMSSYWYNEGQR